MTVEIPVSDRLRDRFETKWEQDENGCWTWTGGIGTSGYGRILVDGENRTAHRVSYAIHHGDPDGGWVLHKCDVRKCVNPEHLYLGDGSDNMEDAYNRGRKQGIKGEDKPRSKITVKDVKRMRDLHAESDMNQKEIAKEFGVSHSQANKVINGDHWSHVDYRLD